MAVFIADVTEPIIGLDILCFYNLLFDIRHRRLIDNITNLTVKAPQWQRMAATLKSSPGSLAITTCARIFRI
jgi:hypothetical protein